MLSSAKILTLFAVVAVMAAPDHLRSRRLNVLNAQSRRRDVFENEFYNLTFV